MRSARLLWHVSLAVGVDPVRRVYNLALGAMAWNTHFVESNQVLHRDFFWFWAIAYWVGSVGFDAGSVI